MGHDFYVRVYGVRSGLAPEDYLLVKLPERTFGNGDLQILTGAHVAGRVYVKGIFVAQAEELLQIGINYQGAADTYANLGFSRDRNHLKLKRLGGVLSVLKSLDEGSQRELAEVLLEEFMAMERDDVNHPFFQKTSEQLANYLFAAFRRVYPDALPSYKTLQHDGVDFGLVNKLLGTRPVDIGPRLYNLLALSEGFKEVGEYMEIYYQALVDLPASELRDLTYEESLGAFAGLCMGLPRKRILFKKFPAGCTKRILTIPRGSRAACKYLRTPSDLEPADELEEEPPLEAGSEDGDVQPHNCLLVADIEEYSFARVHKGGHHRDQSPAEEGDVCNCGPLKFALDVAGCLEMSMDGLLSHLTRGVTTGMLGVSKAKGKPTAEARQRDAERKARAQAELRELRGKKADPSYIVAQAFLVIWPLLVELSK